MGGRYVDELRRITRERGATPQPGGPASSRGDEKDGSRRRSASLLVFLVVISLVGAGWLVIRQLMADAKLQDCAMSGRKNCVPLEINSAGR
jgi:cell division septal protein FtsQ